MTTVEVNIVDHPLAAIRLTRLRDKNTSMGEFRAAVRELARMLMFDATRNLKTAPHAVTTPLTDTIGVTLAQRPLLVPVLRAGLGMVEAAQDLLPEAHIGFVGLAPDEETHQPRSYLESLPADCTGRPVFVLDPMLATGGSALSCLTALRQRGATELTLVTVLAAPEGIARLEGFDGPLRLFTASVDEELDHNAFIRPGLGDAGDRQFGEADA